MACLVGVAVNASHNGHDTRNIGAEMVFLMAHLLSTEAPSYKCHGGRDARHRAAAIGAHCRAAMGATTIRANTAALRHELSWLRDSVHCGRHAAHGAARCAILRCRSSVCLGANIARMAALLYVL